MGHFPVLRTFWDLYRRNPDENRMCFNGAELSVVSKVFVGRLRDARLASVWGRGSPIQGQARYSSVAERLSALEHAPQDHLHPVWRAQPPHPAVLVLAFDVAWLVLVPARPASRLLQAGESSGVGEPQPGPRLQPPAGKREQISDDRSQGRHCTQPRPAMQKAFGITCRCTETKAWGGHSRRLTLLPPK